MRAGQKNVYTCGECGDYIVTVDRDEGTTPAFLLCRATEGCNGRMSSAWYPDEAASLEPTHEWYAPDGEELEQACAESSNPVGVRGHVENGGLLLRELGGDGE